MSSLPTYQDRRRSDHQFRVLADALNAQKQGSVDFVQVGGNDGILADPIQPYAKQSGWSGTILEPVGHYFKLLKQTYQDCPAITLLNVAAGKERTETIYYARQQAVEQKNRFLGQGVASFRRDHVLNFGFTEDEILEASVDVVPLSRIFAERGLGTDLLVVDVEGAEVEVFESMDWRSRVRSVMFESDNLSPSARDQVQRILEDADFIVFWRWPDSFAIHIEECDLLELFFDSERELDRQTQSDLRLLPTDGMLHFQAGSHAINLLGHGWSASEAGYTWSCSDHSVVIIPTELHGRLVRSAVFHYAAFSPVEELQISFILNGSLQMRAHILQSSELVVCSTVMPIRVSRSGCLEIELRFKSPTMPASIGLGNDQRALAIALIKIELLSS
jgi:hypothetical protein